MFESNGYISAYEENLFFSTMYLSLRSLNWWSQTCRTQSNSPIIVVTLCIFLEVYNTVLITELIQGLEKHCNCRRSIWRSHWRSIVIVIPNSQCAQSKQENKPNWGCWLMKTMLLIQKWMLFWIVVVSSLEMYCFSKRIFQTLSCPCPPHGPSGCTHWGHEDMLRVPRGCQLWGFYRCNVHPKS